MKALRWIPLLFVLLAGSTLAQGPTAARKLIEHSMLVTGYVSIDADGRLAGYDLDERAKLPSVVQELIDQAAPEWRFEPVLVDGVPGNVRARMSLRVVASQQDKDNYRIQIRSSYFGKGALSHEERGALDASSELSVARQTKIAYPVGAMRVGAQGTVYVLLRVGRDGRVQDLIPEQVNLRTTGTPRQMESMREMLARAALRGVSDWTYSPPTTGELANDESWSGRVTVDFTLGDNRPTVYGEWHAYIPGPRQRAPWLQEDDLGGNESPDARLAEGFQPIGQGLKLLTPLQQDG